MTAKEIKSILSHQDWPLRSFKEIASSLGYIKISYLPQDGINELQRYVRNKLSKEPHDTQLKAIFHT